MSNDQQAVVKRTITHSYYDPMHANTAREIVEASEWDKLAARLAEAEGREKRLREALESAKSTLCRIHEEAQNCDDDDALNTLDYIIGWAQDADNAAKAALSTEEKP